MGKIKAQIKFFLRDLYWVVFGRRICNPPVPKEPRSFLFVCKGNICRSPFAGALAERVIGNGEDGKVFRTAGLEVKQVEAPPAEAVLAGMKLGIEMIAHRSTGLSAEMVGAADMVFAMEAKQLLELKRRFPQFRDRFFLLPLFAPGQQARGFKRYNIQDPYGKTTSEFHACYRRIESCLQSLRAAMESSMFSARDRVGDQ